ncbi:ATP-dependent protease subunit HslV [Candidatus Zinderia endosymbiont of Aphrophora alni]|uniref:ATP-dependent protease subunit HslV n=1 Tax=Candidatus Zinderia endosymbiont of Aphrophora alni TaxID=3077951 RepID=UPI0030CD1F64
MKKLHGTTILSVKCAKKVSMGGDGQVTLGNIIIKNSTRKIYKIYNKKILVGLAGSTADAFTLLDLFEFKINKNLGNLIKSSVELAKDWRTNNNLRRLEAMLLVADINNILIITGNGEVLQPSNDIGAIGSGGIFAQSAAIALKNNTNLSSAEIVKKSLIIASELCIYTNSNYIIKTIK